ncbi:MAG: alpha-amylase family glycosyl hydrolase, partial [Candidatus Angelobacter sp.]
MFEFHVSRAARDRYRFDDSLFSLNGNVVFANLAASREFAQRINQTRDVQSQPELTVHPAALNAMGLIDEALHAMVTQYRRSNPNVVAEALRWLGSRLGETKLERTLLSFVEEFPPLAVYRRQIGAIEWLASSSEGRDNRELALEELLLLWLANKNPAFRPFRELFDDGELSQSSAYPDVTAALPHFFAMRPGFGAGNQSLVDLLRAPASAAPDSLEGQLTFIRDQWAPFLGNLFSKMVTAMDVLKEEQMAVWMRF